MKKYLILKEEVCSPQVAGGKRDRKFLKDRLPLILLIH